MTRITLSARRSLMFAALFVTSACAGPSPDDTFTMTAPSYDDFRNLTGVPVGDVFAAHCGTLDCHGSAARNLRIYSVDGLRLDPHDVPNQKSAASQQFGTTEAEYQATYESIVSIEPERLSQIVQANGAGSEHWLVLGKGRDVQDHKGGQRLVPGDAADTCIVLWVSGAPVTSMEFQAACADGSVVVPPGGPW
jgi:hypothetical protein